MIPKTGPVRRELRIPLRVVFFKDAGQWYAHCLEFGFLGDGKTKPQALKMLNDAIETAVDFANSRHDIQSLYCSAEPQYHEMFAAGKDVAYGDLTIHCDRITIQEKELREYVPRSNETPIYAHA